MTEKQKSYHIDFQPVGRRGKASPGESLLICARNLGIGISSICGGKGTCKSCRVRVVSGAVSEVTDNERRAYSPAELKEGWRLACQAYPAGDCRIHVPAESLTAPQRTQVEGEEMPVNPEPPVRVYALKLKTPTLAVPTADDENLLAALEKQVGFKPGRVDYDLLKTMPELLRAWKWRCQAAVRGDELTSVIPARSRPLGFAVDLGTTKIAGYILDMESGRTLAARGIMNPQISYGEDIISRITCTVHNPAEGAAVRECVAASLDELCAELCQEAGGNPEDVVEAVIVGNTAMHHLLLGLAVGQLAVAPFVPAVSHAVDVKAGALGLHLAAGAYVHLLPNIAGFVGADHVAMLLATGALGAGVPTVAIDIGTNTEVSFVYKNKVVATSCASGPAFEGGHIKYGMRAAAGAIERVRIDGDDVLYQTIDGAKPVGICGSGILDALAQLYLSGVIDAGGRMTGKHPHLRTRNGQREFVLAKDSRRPVAITQYDIRELQLAKAAIRAGIQALLEAGGCREADIGQVIIAGAFGTYIDIASAVAAGMLPALPLDRFRQSGNSAGMGAKLALISATQREKAREIARRVKYIELSGTPGFNQTFVQASYLGKYKIIAGKREDI